MGVQAPGVQPHEVVHRPAAGRGLAEQVCGRQAVQGCVGGGRVGAGQGGGGVAVQVGAGVAAEGGEHVRYGRGELAQRQVECGADAGVLQVQQAKAAGLVGELVGECGQGPAGPPGEAGGDHPQRQRQSAAQVREAQCGGLLGVDPVGAEDAGQEGGGVLGGEDVQGDGAGGVGDDQPGQAVAAGDDGDAAVAAGQERADLVGVAGVVEDDQQLPVGGQRAEQGGRGRLRLRDPLGRHAEGQEELAQHLDGGRLAHVAEAAQVGVEAAVGQARGVVAGPVQDQGGLADPGGPHHQAHRGLARAGPGQRVELGRPAVETARRARQQIGGVHSGLRCRGGRPDVRRRAERWCWGVRGADGAAPARARGVLQLPGAGRIQAQRLRQRLHGTALRPAGAALLQVGQAPHTHPGRVRQVLLTEPGPAAQGVQQRTEGVVGRCGRGHADDLPVFDVAPPNREPNRQKYAPPSCAGESAWFTPLRPSWIEA